MNERKDFKILTLAITLALIAAFFVFNGGELKAHLQPQPDIVVPVYDDVLTQLLHDLRDKEVEPTDRLCITGAGADPQARCIAREILDVVSDYIITVIQELGRKGDINDTGTTNTFVQNWRNFALEGQYRAEDLWRGILYIAANGDQQLEIPPLLCEHIRNSEAFKSLLPREVDNLIQSGIKRRINSLEEYLVTSDCDSFVDENYETFIQDFNQGGGWDMWFKLIEPQNNIYGAISLAVDELGRQRKIEEQSDIQEANSGRGYLGRRECLALGPSGQCVIWGPVAIPGDVAAQALGAVINQNLGFIAGTDEAGEVGAANQIDIVEIMEKIFGEAARLEF